MSDNRRPVGSQQARDAATTSLSGQLSAETYNEENQCMQTSSTRSDERAEQSTTIVSRLEAVAGKVAMGLILLSLTAVQPALAQNAVCEATGLPGMISGFFQLTTGIGLVGVVVVWQANTLSEMFTIDRDQREGLKKYRRRALKSALVLVILGPLYSVAGAMMGLPLASCVDLTPL